jgi:hypothetical protein
VDLGRGLLAALGYEASRVNHKSPDNPRSQTILIKWDEEKVKAVSSPLKDQD